MVNNLIQDIKIISQENRCTVFLLVAKYIGTVLVMSSNEPLTITLEILYYL